MTTDTLRGEVRAEFDGGKGAKVDFSLNEELLALPDVRAQIFDDLLAALRTVKESS